jgi:hypothetical protein
MNLMYNIPADIGRAREENLRGDFDAAFSLL